MKIENPFFVTLHTQKVRYFLAFFSLTPTFPTSSMHLRSLCFRRSKICFTVTGPSPGTLKSENLDARFTFTGNASGCLNAHTSLGSVLKDRQPFFSKIISDSANPYFRSRKSTWYSRCSRIRISVGLWSGACSPAIDSSPNPF